MKIKELEEILRQYNEESEIIFSLYKDNFEYELQNDGIRHHADSDTICMDLLIK